MRGLCKEEDYAFLGTSEKTTNEETDVAEAVQGEQGDEKDERVRDEKPGAKYLIKLTLH